MMRKLALVTRKQKGTPLTAVSDGPWTFCALCASAVESASMHCHVTAMGSSLGSSFGSDSVEFDRGTSEEVEAGSN
eukprot:790233-Rhodomonas_salina.1